MAEMSVTVGGPALYSRFRRLPIVHALAARLSRR